MWTLAVISRPGEEDEGRLPRMRRPVSFAYDWATIEVKIAQAVEMGYEVAVGFYRPRK